MADFEKRTSRKSFFSWLHCEGGCNRKLKLHLKTEDNDRKFKAKTTSCFGGLWSCIRCRLESKNSKQLNFGESEVEEPQKLSSAKDGLELLDLIIQVQNRRMDDQRSILPSKQSDAENSSANAKENVVIGMKNSKEDLHPETPRSQGLNPQTEKKDVVI